MQIREQVGEAPGSDREVSEIYSQLRVYAERAGVKLVINRNLEVALKLNANGLHLGKTSDFLEKKVRWRNSDNGKGKILGFSAHSLEEVTYAQRQGCDYAFVSPIFPTISKKTLRAEIGLESLAEYVNQTEIPIFALGGISKDNISKSLQTGVRGLAVLGDVFLADNPTYAARTLCNAYRDFISLI